MSRSSDLGRLETEHWGQLQDLASRFEAAWKNADTVDLASFLPAAGDPLRHIALHELIKSDLEARWRRGQVIGIEAYVEKFPELGNVTVLSPALIYEEYRARHLHGDKPGLAGYERRFPRQFAELQKLVREQPLPSMTATPSPAAAPELKQLGNEEVLRIGGDYKMIKLIGWGGFAEVWAAETPAGFPVAIKRILRPLDHAEAQVELRSLGEIRKLRHPYLLQTRDYGLLDNRLYVVMDLADCTLADRLHQCKEAHLEGVPVDELLLYMHEAAEAIDYMHSQKIHHRDIKPKNILILGGHAKVADFGLARMVESQRMTATGSGTFPYMAPEVWKRQSSPHSDQYSLAVSYAELRRGRLPFAGTDMYSLMMDHIEGRAILDPLPDAEQRVLRKALAKDAADRYPNCLAFVQALEEAVDTTAVPSQSSSGVRRRKSTIRSASHVKPDTDDVGTVLPGDTPTEPPTAVIRDTARPTGGTTWQKPAVLGKTRWVLIAIGCAALLGLVGWKLYVLPVGDFQVEAPGPVRLAPGRSTTVNIRVQRNGFDGSINFVVSKAPRGVSLSGLVQAKADNADITIHAERDVELAEDTMTIRAEATGQTAHEVTFPLTVEPAYWKPGWRKATDAKLIEDTQQHRHWSAIEINYDGVPVRFVLVAQQNDDLGDGKRLPTFYMMENKVWNELYARFAAARPAEAGEGWKQGDGFQGGDGVLGPSNAQMPALNMTVEQAYHCAVWMGGHLPTTLEWDKASGYYRPDRASGPFEVPPGRAQTENGPNWQPGEIAVNRNDKRPMPVGTATRDKSFYGCRDMAANGLEWTRDLTTGRQVPLAGKPGDSDTVRLRSKRYFNKYPWLFKFLDTRPEDGFLESWSYTNPRPYIGFRVVLELE